MENKNAASIMVFPWCWIQLFKLIIFGSTIIKIFLMVLIIACFSLGAISKKGG
jgi:hypothetical protein